MTIEEKIDLASKIIKNFRAEKNYEVISSISEGIKNNRYFYEISNGQIVVFLTWDESLIDGKKYIFVNNLWIEKNYRNVNSLTRIRILKKYLFEDVYKFYWFDKKKEKMIYRR